MTSLHHILIVGASAAGLACAETLRREGFRGDLTLVGDEKYLPYDRPPLSKQVLQGIWEVERTLLRRPELIAALGASWRLGVRANGLDVAARQLLLSDGSRLAYDGLVIATGVSPRRFANDSGLAGVHVMRTVEDALELRRALAETNRIVIIGAGLIGSEAAASARQMGIEVTLVDPLPVPLSRVVGPLVGGLIAELHLRHNVDVRMNTGVRHLISDGEKVTGVKLTDGHTVETGAVLVAIGATPNIAWLADSGLPIGNGVECDEYCRVAPNIVAAGDVASWHHLGLGRRLRTEHRTNAAEQGAAAARSLLHKDAAPFSPVPFFWTDQYDVKIQVYGLVHDDSVARHIRGDLDTGRFAYAYEREGQTDAFLAWNMPRDAIELRAALLAEATYAA